MRRVFAARGLPVKDRAHVSQACVVSRLLHGAGTWLTLSAAQARKVQGQYMRPLRRIAGHDAPPAEGSRWPSALETLAATGQAPVQAHIAAARLRLAARISVRGTPAIQGLAQSWTGAGWRKALTCDMRLTQAVLPKLGDMPSPSSSPAAWEAFRRRYPGAWSGIMRKMVQQAADEPAAFLAALAACGEVAEMQEADGAAMECAGNSGGPLLDSQGRMIGINSQILSPAGVFVGVGFAIPTSIIRHIVPQLMSGGRVSRPRLGVGVQSVRELREQTRLPYTSGLLVIEVVPGSPAALAGLRGLSRNHLGDIELGDVIISIDGTAVNHQDDLTRILDSHQVGDEIELMILRGEDEVTVTIKLSETSPSRRGSERRKQS